MTKRNQPTRKHKTFNGEKTDAEVAAFMASLWPDYDFADQEDTWDRFDYIDIWPVDDKLMVEVSSHYVARPVNLALLMRMAEFFGTKEIDVEDEHTLGCETCDFGSTGKRIFTIDLVPK